MAARIVSALPSADCRRDDDDIGEPCRDLAHDRPLAAVAVAATAEHDHDTAGGERAHRGQHIFQRVGLVGVVDIHRRTVGGGADMIEPTRRTFSFSKDIKALATGVPWKWQARRNQRVRNLEIARKRRSIS